MAVSTIDMVKFLHDKRMDKLQPYMQGIVRTLFARIHSGAKYIEFSHNETRFIERAYWGVK
jgi:hypothetical protein